MSQEKSHRSVRKALPKKDLEGREEKEVTQSFPRASLSKSRAANYWLVAGIISFILASAFAIFAWFAIPSARDLIGQPNSGDTSPTGTPKPTPEAGMTLLLMGRGGAGHDGGALADTIVVARILEQQKRIVLLSIPRDLWVQIPYDGKDGIKGKINSAYAIGIDARNYSGKVEKYTGTYGGGALAKDVVNQVTGLGIDKYVTIDFSGFEQAIDTIGGIDLTVDKAFTDYEYPIKGREETICQIPPPVNDQFSTPAPTAADTSSYPAFEGQSIEDEIKAGKIDANILPKLPKEFPCRYEALRFSAGEQDMTGTVALKYVRSRHSSEDGNDFARSRRQRILLEAVVERLFSINAITKIPTFLSTLRSHIDTDMSTTDIVGLLPKASEYRKFPITSLTLSSDNYLGQGYTADRQFALTPLTGEMSYEAIKNWIGSTVDPNLAFDSPTIEVTSFWKNATGSATLAQQLVASGYSARTGQLVMKNATTSATLIYSNEKISIQTLKKIQKLAGVSDPFVQFSSPSAKFQPKSDISILLP